MTQTIDFCDQHFDEAFDFYKKFLRRNKYIEVLDVKIFQEDETWWHIVLTYYDGKAEN